MIPNNNIIVYNNSTIVYSKTVKGRSTTKSNKSKLLSIKVTATVYNAVESQTDSSPHITADGTDIREIDINRHRVLAVSPNLLKRFGGMLSFGDSVIVNGIGEYSGYWIVHDVTNDRYENRIDLLVPNHIRVGYWERAVLTIRGD